MPLDLNSLLREYSRNHKSLTINVNQFLDSLKKHAAAKQGRQEWAPWAENAGLQFGKELTGLIESKKCTYKAKEDGDGSVFLDGYCRDLINTAYQDAEKLSSVIFPDEVSLAINIPPDCKKIINLVAGNEAAMEYIENNNPDDIVVLQFPDGCGTALITSSLMPRRLLDIALLKIKNYFNKDENNKLHVFNVIKTKTQNKDNTVKDYIEHIALNPSSCFDGIERFDDFVYVFWISFCSYIKQEYNVNTESNTEHLILLQAVWIIELHNNYWHSQLLKKKEKDAMFLVLEEQMNNPPFYFSIKDISDFKNDKGVPLLNIYSRQDLEEYINKAVSENKDGDMPSWLTLQKVFGDRVFIKKEHYFPLCVQMIDEIKPQVKMAISKRWKYMILDFKREAAMDNDDEFEKLIKKQVDSINPEFLLMVEEDKLILIYREIEKKHGTLPASWQIFGFDRLLPFRDIFGLRRRDIIASIRSGLPFWYSSPFLFAIYKFFQRLFGKSKPGFNPGAGSQQEDASARNMSPLQRSAYQIQSEIVPEGSTPEQYLAELEQKWSVLRDEKARQDLITDVRSLLKDKLRYHIKISKSKPVKLGELRDLAAQWIEHNPALTNIKDQESLHLYMELYMMGLLLKGAVLDI